MALYSIDSTTLAAIADAIREKTGGTSGIPAADFPEEIRKLAAGSPSTNLLGLTFDLATLTTYFTPKVMEYYGGYYWIGGNDSAGIAYVAYSASLASGWTLVRAHSSRVHPVNALGFDLANNWVFLFGDTTAYSARCVIRLNNIFNYPTDNYDYTYWAHGLDFTDAVTHDDLVWAVAGGSTTAYTTANGGVGTAEHVTTLNLFRCCMYNGYPVAITEDGFYSYKSSIEVSAKAGEGQIARDLTCYDVAQMGDYLCVVGSKSDGTYLYYTKGTPGALTWSCLKISHSVVTPIGMVYANGVYLVAYKDANGSLRFWISEDITIGGVANVRADGLDGYIPVAITTNGSTFGLALDNGSAVGVGRYTPGA